VAARALMTPFKISWPPHFSTVFVRERVRFLTCRARVRGPRGILEGVSTSLCTPCLHTPANHPPYVVVGEIEVTFALPSRVYTSLFPSPPPAGIVIVSLIPRYRPNYPSSPPPAHTQCPVPLPTRFTSALFGFADAAVGGWGGGGVFFELFSLSGQDFPYTGISQEKVLFPLLRCT
jgi:hypothetical protein